MTDEPTSLAQAPSRYPRVLGRRGDAQGPSLIVMTGIHGNEPSGPEAALRVLAWLDEKRPNLSGRVLFLAGNLRALADRRRYIDLDLNRQWTREKVAALRSSAPDRGGPAEDAEQRDLLDVLGEAIRSARGELHFLDLHTSSADGPPFVTIGDTLRNRKFARKFPLPLILGLEEQVDGALLELMNNHGFVTMGVEAGYHDSPDSVDRHEAVLWLALVNSGVLESELAPDLEPYRALLRKTGRGTPRVIEVRHRHAIDGDDAFRMEPGYFNFRPVRRGELLARERRGPVRSPEDGLILLPLYQGLGNDGFFVSREVRPLWLGLSALLRRLKLNGVMHLLPGVRRDPHDPEVLIVDTRVARIYPLDVFHLFGFRKVRQFGADLLVSRRRFDLEPPAEISFC